MSDGRDTMYAYYAAQEVLPTYGGFESEADLAAHERHRRRLFTDKLKLPPRLFAGARLLELGPDAGENSLVFARWGAECHLAEPHLRAHETIRSYFEHFGLTGRLAALEHADLEGYPAPDAPDDRFHVVDAEGFVNAIQPVSAWIDKLAQLLAPEGLAVVFYNERFGGLLELTWKVVNARHRELIGAGSLDSARALFGTKWDSIPHKRAIESWAMDVLENPFVRLRFFVEPVSMCVQAAAAGLRLYSSWPDYCGGLDPFWFKRERSTEEETAGTAEFIRRSRLSHVFGRRHFLTGDPAPVEDQLSQLVIDFDSLIDGFDAAVAARCDRALADTARTLSSAAVLTSDADRKQSLATVAMLRSLLELLACGSADEIRMFANADRAFVESWGMPSHFAVFRRDDRRS